MAWTDEIVEQLEAALDGRQERKPDRELARPRPYPQRGHRKGPSAGLGGTRQIAGRGCCASSPSGPPPPAHHVAAPRLTPAAPRMMRGATALAIAPQALAEAEEQVVRERRCADVAEGDDRRAEGVDVPLAARRPGDRRIPLLWLARGVRSVLRLPWRARLPARPGASARTRSPAPSGGAAIRAGSRPERSKAASPCRIRRRRGMASVYGLPKVSSKA